ncbi:MAG: peptidyl-prolyl cis-trans isomerase, partial [Candidatus Sumerlaeaceae bacterium]
REEIATRGASELFAEAGETSGELAQVVRLLAPPAEDLSGGVVARAGDTEIHAGAVARYLRERGYSREFLLNPKDPRLDQMMEDFLQKELASRAAVAQGMHLRPGVATQLYDYQRTLLAQQWLAEERQKSREVAEDEIRKYYESHHERFVTPERLSVGALATTTDSALLRAKELYEKGASWRDLNTSFTTHQELRALGGLLGVVAASDTQLPVVGEAAELIPKLRSLDEGKTYGPVRIGSYYWLFVIFKRMPRNEQSFDEVRGKIEEALRSQKAARTESQIKQSLSKKYALQLEPDAKARIIEQLKVLEGNTTSTASRVPNQPEAPTNGQ